MLQRKHSFFVRCSLIATYLLASSSPILHPLQLVDFVLRHPLLRTILIHDPELSFLLSSHTAEECIVVVDDVISLPVGKNRVADARWVSNRHQIGTFVAALRSLMTPYTVFSVAHFFSDGAFVSSSSRCFIVPFHEVGLDAVFRSSHCSWGQEQMISQGFSTTRVRSNMCCYICVFYDNPGWHIRGAKGF